LRVILALVRDYRPLLFFSVFGLGLSVMALLATAVGLSEWSTAHPGFWTVCCMAAGISWIIFGCCLAIGLGTETINRRLGELDHLVRKSRKSRAMTDPGLTQRDWFQSRAMIDD
jgi:hypothetical protein